MFDHRRITFPTVRDGIWRIACDCGWRANLPPTHYRPEQGKAYIEAALERLFVDHLPADARHLYVRVDRRPGHEGAWVMPEGVPVSVGHHYESDGTFRAAVIGRVSGDFPVGEVITESGQIFRLDDNADDPR